MKREAEKEKERRKTPPNNFPNSHVRKTDAPNTNFSFSHSSAFFKGLPAAATSWPFCFIYTLDLQAKSS
jgi:hypothetical protein